MIDARNRTTVARQALTSLNSHSMAYVEMKMMMVKMLWNFDLRLVDKDEDWLDQPVFLIFKERPLMVQVRPRAEGN